MTCLSLSLLRRKARCFLSLGLYLSLDQVEGKSDFATSRLRGGMNGRGDI